MRAPCDDPPALGARERVLAGLPEITGGDGGVEGGDHGRLPHPPPPSPGAYLADVGYAELAAAEMRELRVDLARARGEAAYLRGRVCELEVLRDDLERRLVLERERAERVEGTLAAILQFAQPSDLAGLAAREAQR